MGKGGNMIILELNQGGVGTEIGLFETIDQGREFISQLDGYACHEEDGFLYESLQADRIPEYLELEFHHHRVPFTKFMFTGEGPVDIYWKEIPDLSSPGAGLVDGATRVDAYSIENQDLKDYIERRESAYQKVKNALEQRGYEVSRQFFGSEDGEAILYKKPNGEEWHFLSHLDPGFCEQTDTEELLEDL